MSVDTQSHLLISDPYVYLSVTLILSMHTLSTNELELYPIKNTNLCSNKRITITYANTVAYNTQENENRIQKSFSILFAFNLFTGLIHKVPFLTHTCFCLLRLTYCTEPNENSPDVLMGNPIILCNANIKN